MNSQAVGHEIAPLVPFLESNQGLFSALALAAAIFVAWWEYRQARRAKAAQVRDPASIACEQVNLVIATCEEGKTSEGAGFDAQSTARQAGIVLAKIEAASPPSASLVLALHEAHETVHRIATRVGIAHEDDTQRARVMTEWISKLTASKEKLLSVLHGPI